MIRPGVRGLVNRRSMLKLHRPTGTFPDRVALFSIEMLPCVSSNG